MRESEKEREWWGREGGHLNGEKNSELISCSSYVLKVERCWSVLSCFKTEEVKG